MSSLRRDPPSVDGPPRRRADPTAVPRSARFSRRVGTVARVTSPRPLHVAARFVAVAVLALLLAACAEPSAGSTDPGGAPPWTAAEIDAVFDLAELGTDLGLDPETGDLRLAGRPLPSELLEARPHLTMGRDRNLLGLADDALAAMHPDAARRLRLADPAELRRLLAGYGASVAAVSALRRDDGRVDLDEIRALAADLDRGPSPAAASGAGRPGARLLHDLGLVDGER